MASLISGIAALTLVRAAAAFDLTWIGPTNGDWFAPGNWSGSGDYPRNGDTVAITNGKILLTNETENLASFSISNATLTCSNWNTALKAAEVALWSNGVLTLPPAFTTNHMSNRVHVVCSNFTLNAGGTIQADERGYLASNGPGAGVTGSIGASGAGHGGRGGASTPPRGPAYGVTNGPLDPGSGGGRDTAYGASGGSGGGAVRIEAAGTVTVHGTVTANGGAAFGGTSGGAHAGGGSGGAIYISCATFGGSSAGMLRANGGNKGGSVGGGGGGGRIAVEYTNTIGTVGVRFSVAGGLSYISDKFNPDTAEMGTLYLSTTNALEDVWKNQVVIAHLVVPGFTNWSSPELVVSNVFVKLPEDFSCSVSNTLLLSTNCGLFLGPNQNFNLSAFTMLSNSMFQLGTNSAMNCTNLNLQAGARLKLLTNSAISCAQLSLVGTNALILFQADSSLNCTGDVFLDNGQLNMGTNPVLNCGGNMTLTNWASLVICGGQTNGLGPSYGALVGVTNTLSIASNCWVYPYSDPTNGGSVLMRMAMLTILDGGGINADARGYQGSYGPGRGTNGSIGAAGGGYGGKGGRGGSVNGGPTYGSTNAPLDPGSGGGQDTFYSAAGGYGGGLVRIEAAGQASIDGTLTANGGDGGGSYAGGGSGGAIFLSCGSIIGGVNGSLRANGGNGYGASVAGGGGGGRISVAVGFSAANLTDLIDGVDIPGLTCYSQAPTFLGTLSATNGLGAYTYPTNPLGAYPGTKQFMRVLAPSERLVTITGDPLQYDAPATNGYGSCVVANSSEFTNAVTSPANETNGQRWSCYGWRATDTALESTITNGDGQQAVFTVNTNVTLTWLWTNQYKLLVTAGPDGTVNTNDLNGWYTNGTVVPGILATADDPTNYYFSAWGGADVPVGMEETNPLTLTMDQPRTNITAAFPSKAGTNKIWNGVGNWTTVGNWTAPGPPGTNDRVILQSGTSTLSSAKGVASLVISNGAVLIFTNWTTCLSVTGSVTILSNGVIILPPAFTTNQMSNRIYVVCDEFVLHTGAVLQADTRGYLSSNGPGCGTNGSIGSGGGGYGGKGGTGGSAPGGPACGNTNAPLDPGSGGGRDTFYSALGGSGGGVIRIDARRGIIINGTMTANGGQGGNSYAGGGSGGAIYLTCTKFSGSSSGILRANGGNGYGVNVAGGGGGGRIAVWIGVPADIRQRYLDGLPNYVIRTNIPPEAYLGSAFAVNGTGVYSYVTNVLGAFPGTCFFFTYTPRGSVFYTR